MLIAKKSISFSPRMILVEYDVNERHCILLVSCRWMSLIRYTPQEA
jgi:hypothetical protein